MSEDVPPFVSYLDTLNRQNEVAFISSLVVKQTRARANRSFVLSIDAEYGVGKSFFLDLLGEELAENHPVARVDAWADDSGNEPSVAIMAAIEEALEGYLDKPTAKDAVEKLDRARRNILPILAKGAGGAFSKAIARYVGDVVADEIGSILDEPDEEQSPETEAISEGAEAGVEAVGARLTELADKHAKAMIADYRKRKTSRLEFKKAMAELVASLSKQDGGKQGPLVVIVDELDRCRPDYAIKVLEEIKHFFDVPGVAFVLAMHRKQLSKSVCAVYGPEFDSDDYLRRFFDLSLNLLVRDFSALVADEIEKHGINPDAFIWPPDNQSAKNDPDRISAYIATVLSSLNSTAREAKATMSYVALFAELWDQTSRIELTVLITLVWAQVKGIDNFTPNYFNPVGLSNFGTWLGGSQTSATVGDVYKEVFSLARKNLTETRHGPRHGTVVGDYVRLVFSSEFNALKKERETGTGWVVPTSSISEYRDRIRFLNKLLES